MSTRTDILCTNKNSKAHITLNRPDALNALRYRTLLELAETLEECQEDPKIGVVVITGAGDKAFCVGGDVGELGIMSKQSVAKTNRLLLKIASLITNMEKPVIAAVNGLCIGGGNELNFWCDLTIASERAMFGHPEAKLGAVPLWGGTQLLASTVGQKKAREIIFLAELYPAEEAQKLGLVNKVVPHELLEVEVDAWCEKILTMSPQALRVAKTALNYEQDRLTPAFTHGMAMVEQNWDSAEMQEGILAFQKKRQPDFNRFRK